MLKDITLGQFFPGDSIVHKLDPRVKIVSVLIFIVALFITNSVYAYVFFGLLLALVIRVSRLNPKIIFKGLKPLLFIIIFTTVLNMFYTPGEALVEFGIFKITLEGIKFSVFMVFRIIYLVIGTSLLTYTTSPIALTDALEDLMGPLKKLKVPVSELSMMMTIALRFIPTLIEETNKIMDAQKSRGADFESGNLIARAKSLIPILVPLFVSAFRRADELAIAMECRCYSGSNTRTKMKELKANKTDYAVLSFMILVLIAVIFSKIYLGV